MSLPPLADAGQLEERLGYAPPSIERAEELLRYASSLVRAVARRNWVDENGDIDDVPDGIPGVVVAAVERAVQNPTGATQENAGPFSASWGAEAAQRVFLTKADRTIVRAAVGGPKAFTIYPPSALSDE